MAAGKSEQPVETLGQRLAALRPGSPCPCCGAPLEGDSPPTRAGGRSGFQSLVCERCGCRVDPVQMVAPGAEGVAYELAA